MPRSKDTAAAAAAKKKQAARRAADQPVRGETDEAASDWPFAPACCATSAFALMHEQTLPADPGPAISNARPRKRLDGEAGLLNACCAVALHARAADGDDAAEADPAAVAFQLDELADDVALRYGVAGIEAVRERAKVAPQGVMAHLHAVLFDDAGFRGNGGDYYNAKNSFLPDVLATRRGLPISLALVYKLVADRLGLRCWGVGLPGHFVAGVDCGGTAWVDCFHGGRLLDREDAADRVAACAGPEAGFDDDMLRPVTHRHWVTRLIQNLLQTYTTAGRHQDVAAMLELELLLWPDQAHLQRDLALVLARLGQTRPASRWLNRYLAADPDDPQRQDLEELLGVLG